MQELNERVYVSLKISRVIGQDTVEIEQGQYVSPSERNFTLNQMGQIASQALKDYIDNTAPTIPLNPADDDTGIGGYWSPVVSVHVNTDNGNKRVFMLTNEYSRYGVEIYPETLAAAGYMIAGLNADFSPHGWEVCIKKNGKGRPRIYALRTPSSIPQDDNNE